MLRKGEQIAIADTAKLVSAGIDQGLIPIADPELLATAMIGVATVLTHHHFLHDAGRTTSVDELADATVRFCLGGMSGT
jgi:hypothetical protein